MSNEIYILVVDDNFVNRQYFSMSLKKSGYKVSTAKSGFEAIKNAKIINFNLILMDIRMSDMDGYETAGHIRQIPNYMNTPILATSAENIPKEYEKRFNGFLLKPISPKQLSQIVEKHCQNTKALAKTFNVDSALKYAYHDKEILQKLITLFLKDLPIQMELLTLNLKKADYSVCRDIIHKTRGSCKICGAEVLDQQFGTLSQIIKNNKDQQINQSIAQIKITITDFIRTTEQEI